jgi:glycosyltransferase involved in cell wall biosynthesis
MEINLNYVHAENMGYGRLGVKLHRALEAKGVEVFDHLPAPEGDGPKANTAGAEGRHAGTAGTVCWVSVPTHATGWWKGQSPVIFTMWEATRLPESFRKNLHHFDRILVPSDQNVELFSRYHPDVRRVLLGIDPAEWHYVQRTAPGCFFDFLIGGSGARKGTDLAFEAFKRAFPTVNGSGPIPRLVMKNPRGEEFAHDGRVLVLAGKLSADEERDLYASSHCYLQPSRGEGFGLQPLQAMAQGMPTILTDAHGHESFAHLGIGIGADLQKSDYFIYGDAGDWWEPRLDDLVDAMRWVYANYDRAEEDARVTASVVGRTFAWANTADQFIEHLDLNRTLSDKGEWFKPTSLRFRVRVLRDMTLDVADRRITLKGGKDYFEQADVKRILAESGHLDPSCIEDDAGLTDEQVKRLGIGDGQSDYCHACGQRAGTGLTKADDLYLASEPAAGDADLTKWHAGA